MPRPKPEKLRTIRERNEMLDKLTEPDAIRILLRGYARRPMSQRALGKVKCGGAAGRPEHYVLMNQVRAGYRGLYLCWECSRAAGFEKAEQQAQAELEERKKAA